MHEAHTGGAPLAEGYAPFCKHVFVPNFTSAQLSTLRITKYNEHLLRSGCARLHSPRHPGRHPATTLSHRTAGACDRHSYWTRPYVPQHHQRAL